MGLGGHDRGGVGWGGSETFTTLQIPHISERNYVHNLFTFLPNILSQINTSLTQNDTLN